MAHSDARSGHVVSVRPLGDQLSEASTTVLIKADQLQDVRLVLPAGKRLPEHHAPGEITVQCLEGRLEFVTATGPHVLEAGDLIHLGRRQTHAVHALEDSSALLTLYIARTD